MNLRSTKMSLIRILFLFSLVLQPLVASADDGGKCGDNVYYSYNSATHTLTISGEGNMDNYYGGMVEGWDQRPWRSYCNNIHSIIIDSGVTSIGSGAFADCGSLTSVTIPNSVTSIGNFSATGGCVFSRCTSLTSITIPNSVTGIAYYTFENCTGLTSIEIPNSVTIIGEGAFSGCTSLTSITIPNSVTRIESGAFNGTAWYNKQADGLVYAGKLAYQYKGEMPANTHISIKEGTIGFGEYAFNGCKELTSITIPSSVTSISYDAFSGCGLSSIIIPKSVTTIEMYAFAECSYLTSIVSEIVNPFEIDGSVFKGVPSNAQLIVPKGTKAAYLSTAGWNQFTNIVEADSGGEDVAINGINYQISSESEHTIMVRKGDYGRVLEVPATITYGNNTWNVIGLEDGALDNCENLAAVIWGPKAQFNVSVNNPNMLLYVSDEKYASRNVRNVVVNNIAQSIELIDASSGNDFYCPKAFTARKISYSHYYNMETGLGDSKGWETIVLPFDVQNYTHATKGEIEPFTTWTMGSRKKPFWLFELTAGGYKDVAGIKANTPYIISMPNNRQYEQQYQIPGIVTFSATNAEVKKSDDLKPVSYQNRTFVPNYTNQNNLDYLLLNVNNSFVTYFGADAGSKFIGGLRNVHPFEAYMTTTDGTRSIDVLDGMMTEVKGIGMVEDGECDMKVYDVRGILLKTSSSMDEVRKGLKAGVYIVNGKKMIIK